MKDEIMEKLLLSDSHEDNIIGVTLWIKKYGAKSLWEHTRALGISYRYWYTSNSYAVLYMDYAGEERPIQIKIYNRGIEPYKYKPIYDNKRNLR